jgi:hypothetical protein
VLRGQSGDIAPVHPFAAAFTDIVSVECKAYKSLDYHQLFLQSGRNPPTIIRFYQQCLRDAKVENKVPMLVMKQNFHPAVTVIPTVYVTGGVILTAYGVSILPLGLFLATVPFDVFCKRVKEQV